MFTIVLIMALFSMVKFCLLHNFLKVGDRTLHHAPQKVQNKSQHTKKQITEVMMLLYRQTSCLYG